MAACRKDATTVAGQQCGLNPEALEKAQDETRGNIPPTMLEAAIRTYLASLPPVDAEPVAWDWWQLMQDSMGGWEHKTERYSPVPAVKTGHIRDLQPLYPAAAIIALQGARDVAYAAYKSEKEASAHYREYAAQKSNEKIEEMRRAKTAEAEVARLKTERDELQEALDLRWEADMRAITEWREVTGRELTLPDHIDLVHFLLMGLDLQVSENQKAEAEVARLKAERDELLGEVKRLAISEAVETRSAEEHEAENARLKHQVEGYQHHLRECEQIAGKALGYPWYKDDQKNFPGATEADGVCIGEHVGDTIVAELASSYARLKDELAEAHRVVEAADALIADVRRRYPGEDLRCPFMVKLDESARSFRDGQKTGEKG